MAFDKRRKTFHWNRAQGVREENPVSLSVSREFGARKDTEIEDQRPQSNGSWLFYSWSRNVVEFYNRNFIGGNFSVVSKVGRAGTLDESEAPTDPAIPDHPLNYDLRRRGVKNPPGQSECSFGKLEAIGSPDERKSGSDVTGNTAQFACPVCLLGFQRDKLDGLHVEVETEKLKEFSERTLVPNIAQWRVIKSPVTRRDGEIDRIEGGAGDIRAPEAGGINIPGGAMPRADDLILARMSSSALRYKDFIQVKRNRKCRLVEWRKTRRRRDIGDIITRIQRDVVGHARNPLPVDPKGSRVAKNSEKKVRDGDDNDDDDEDGGGGGDDDDDENIDVEM